MQPTFKPDAVWAPSPTDQRFLAAWPAFPACQHHLQPDYAAMLASPQPLPPSGTPLYCVYPNARTFPDQYGGGLPALDAVCGSREQSQRKLLLRRSVLDLVTFHRRLSLTDTELLRWYLSLTATDREIILDEGGFHHFLLTHPGLELSQGHVYVKQTSLQMLEMLPGDMRKDLTWAAYSNLMNTSPELCEVACSNPAVQQMAHSLTLPQPQAVHKLKRSSIRAAVSSELKEDGCRLRSQDSATPPCTIQAQSERPVESSFPPARLQSVPHSDGRAAESRVQSTVSRLDEGDQCHTVLKEDGSVLMCIASNSLLVRNAGARPDSVSSDPPAAGGEALGVRSTAEKFTSMVPRAPGRDAAVNTEEQSCTSMGTQTEGTDTAEQSIMTEVRMADLDWVAEEFVKLQTRQGSRELKEKIQSGLRRTQKHKGAEGGGPSDDEVRNGCQLQHHRTSSPYLCCCCFSPQSTQLGKEEEEGRKAAALAPSEGCVKQSGSEEVWYDAKEELQLPGPPAAAGVSEADDPESAGEESSSSSSVLYVSNLPGDVTRSKVRQLFENFQPSDVSISTLKNNLRVAMVIVDGSEAAEAAVRELDGHRLCHRAIRVRLVGGAAAPQDAAAAAAPTSVADKSPADKKMASLGSGVHRKVVCIRPTAQATCVPLRFGTMGSLDALTAQLSRLHPDLDRLRIQDALMELKAAHRGALGGLPLSTIRDMTSDLLTRNTGGGKAEQI